MTRLQTIDGELQRPQKSASDTAVAAAITLTTSYQAVTPTIDLGNAPRISAMLDWKWTANTQTLSVQIWVSHDGVVFAPAPSFGSPTVSAPTATSVANVAVVTYLGSSWLSPDTLYSLCPFEADLPGWRFAQLYVKSSAAAGTLAVTSTIRAGTGL